MLPQEDPQVIQMYRQAWEQLFIRKKKVSVTIQNYLHLGAQGT